MKKTLFSNRTFYYLLIIYIFALLIYSIYEIVKGNIYGTIPFSIQLVLLFLIIRNHRYAKIAVFIWAIGFLLLADCLQLLVSLVDSFDNGFIPWNHTLL
jgi:hypothetical protein